MSKYRLAVISFSRALLTRTGGITKMLFSDMIRALPDDAKILGFTENNLHGDCRILIESATFKEVDQGSYHPQIEAYFTSHPPRFDRLDMSQALDSPNPNAPCSHAWNQYVGIQNTYRYCTKCGDKENP